MAHISPLPKPVDDDLPALNFYPEQGRLNWCDSDSRCPLAAELTATDRQRKLVLICHHAQTVLDLERWLAGKRRRTSSRFPRKHGFDRARPRCGLLADHEQGARILLFRNWLRGRNFQFARHLVLFDLPFNCDLIEQRIGRLDRIGQNTIFKFISLFCRTYNRPLCPSAQPRAGFIQPPQPRRANTVGAPPSGHRARHANGRRAG